jgi:hypothetical protein
MYEIEFAVFTNVMSRRGRNILAPEWILLLPSSGQKEGSKRYKTNTKW